MTTGATAPASLQDVPPAALLRATAHAMSPERAYMAVAAMSAIGAMVILPLARPPTAGPQTAAALGAMTVLCLLLAASHRLPDSDALHVTRTTGLFVVGVLAGVPGWFFGSFSGFSAVVVLGMMLAGTVAGAVRRRWPALPAWGTYAGLALGQALAFAMPFARVVGDRSLVPVFFYFREPSANQVVSHVALQAIMFGAFVGARRFQKQYLDLADKVQQADLAGSLRETLLDEARADYMRALVAGRRASNDNPQRARWRLGAAAIADPSDTGILDRMPTRVVSTTREQEADGDGETVALASREPSGRDPQTPATPPASAPAANTSPSTAEMRWDEAYRAKMRGQFRAVAISAAFGCIVVARIAHHLVQVFVAWTSIAAVVALAWYQRRLAQTRSETAYWPWAIIAALSVGPSYAFGFHSSFAAVITALLFLGGLFRARQRVATGADRRIVVLAALCVAQAAAFTLVVSGLAPDIGNVPIWIAGAAPYEPVVSHMLMQGVYVSAFVAGWLVDRRYDALMSRAERASGERVRQEEMLATTRAAIDRLQAEDGEGIFARHKIGRFELRRLCARGGMGDVYDATDATTGRRVAVKLIRYEKAADPVMLRMFVAESTALGRVRSQHVAEVLDAGGLDDDLPYVAMEFIEGPPLSKVLRARRQLPFAEVRDLVRDATAGLAAIHRAGLVHRDVKPENIMRSAAAAPAPWKIVDLGVAQVGDRAGSHESLIVGTPQYMAPEQAKGDADARSDLYSLSLVVYRALTGRSAGLARTADGVRIPASPRWFVALPQDVEYALRIGLASDPSERFASAQEMSAAFQAAFAGTLADDVRRRARALLAREPWAVPSHVGLLGTSARA